MKSFTRSPPDIQSIRADKRFDALIKKEINEHQHIISSHHKEMQDLRDSLRIAMEKFESISSQNTQELKDFKTYTVCMLGILKEKLSLSENLIQEHKKIIESLHDELLSFHVVYENKMDAQKAKIDLENQIKDNNNNYLKSFHDLQLELKTLFNILKNDLEKFKINIEKEIVRLEEKDENNFYLSKIDRNAVLKQVRVYEKSMFIIEKKIENIYTLIERINKRSEVCHKPE